MNIKYYSMIRSRFKSAHLRRVVHAEPRNNYRQREKSGRIFRPRVESFRLSPRWSFFDDEGRDGKKRREKLDFAVKDRVFVSRSISSRGVSVSVNDHGWACVLRVSRG